MKVLWLTYLVFPEALKLLGKTFSSSRSGGWLFSSADLLSKHDNVNLVVASPTLEVDQLCSIQGEHIKYYLYPYGKGVDKYNDYYGLYYKRIITEEKPDIIHIHGFESTIPLAFFNHCDGQHVVVSIQGLVSGISKYYNYGLTIFDILRSVTLRDLLCRNTLFHQKANFIKKAKLEIAAIKKASHVIGRTNWDKSHVLSINKSINYHFCNETLRPEFYNHEWVYEKCSKHTIFISQASYPLKGLHMLLKAIYPLIPKYPLLQVRIAGNNNLASHSFRDKLKMTGYNNYIRKEIKRLHLEKSVCFTGPLGVNDVIKELLSANVFICPSSIENSSNSLCEAQLLGVPCIASYVGGTPDLIPNQDMGQLYRFEETEMLTFFIDKVFEESSSFDNTVMRKIARERHSPDINLRTTLSIYAQVLQDH